MRARDLAVEYETIGLDSDALDAARLMAEHRLPALLVVDDQGAPRAILPASQMIKILVPAYVVEDPTLAAVVDERHADRLCEALAGRKVSECLSQSVPPPPVAAADDTALEVAAQMAQARSPLVAVVEEDEVVGAEKDKSGGRLLGVITASHLLERLLAATSHGPAPA
ncbi:CBS domain-containing protein [Streptomyces pluripotens]|uniref:CBS domain-containing protein n=1 Tax=Streptomyces pluripotens TaxID=1355015 RepID=A0A221NZW2_9ACTN|nr:MULTISPECIES: CBS domain-containing protein [Streptomyces]ARP71069.1 CBS domain-containing protein [Streptomyces pluripotens]ASN25318.1 CBS domain-containing protein [Streptomyces pluripotens]KIE25954.1 CBS domain protein [Streptomyces sp. MUSC 125]MCH0557158.1 CBS domain-containing protein [Streptomyces sp. MUM 16J]